MTELRGIKEVDGGLEIGALTTLTEVVRHPVVREQFGLLMEAAELVASPQIRNQGTLGGNVSQDTRCWYYRSGWTCYRAGGQHLLRGHADGDQPGARDSAGGPVRGGEPVGHGAGADCAGRADGDPEPRAASGWWRRKTTSWGRRSTSCG